MMSTIENARPPIQRYFISGKKRCEWLHNDSQCGSIALEKSQLCEYHAYQNYLTETERESLGNASTYSFEEWKRLIGGAA
jgi:hypothetical protein